MRFRHGDLVRIADDLGPSMQHFTAGCDAIVVDSYAGQFGRGPSDDYTLYIKGSGRVSWYHAPQLTLIERGRADLMEAWEQEEAKEAALKGDLDWIFTHGAEVCEGTHHATVEALAACLGIDDLWGERGEGITYFMNAVRVMTLAEPYLRRNDKQGWLDFVASSRKLP